MNAALCDFSICGALEKHLLTCFRQDHKTCLFSSYWRTQYIRGLAIVALYKTTIDTEISSSNVCLQHDVVDVLTKSVDRMAHVNVTLSVQRFHVESCGELFLIHVDQAKLAVDKNFENWK